MEHICASTHARICRLLLISRRCWLKLAQNTLCRLGIQTNNIRYTSIYTYIWCVSYVKCDVLSMETGDIGYPKSIKESDISPDLWHLLTRRKAKAWLQHSFFAWHGQATPTGGSWEITRKSWQTAQQHSKWYSYGNSGRLGSCFTEMLCASVVHQALKKTTAKGLDAANPQRGPSEFCTVLPHVMLSCSPPCFCFCLV